MTGVSPATQIINHVRVPTCCVYLLMMTAVVALMVLVALAASEAAEGSHAAGQQQRRHSIPTGDIQRADRLNRSVCSLLRRGRHDRTVRCVL